MTSPVIDADIVDSFGERIAPAAAADTEGLIVPLRLGFRKIKFKFASVDGRLGLAPSIRGIWFFDASATAGSRWKKLLDDRQSLLNAFFTGGTGTTLDSWDADDFFYVQLSDRAGGIRIEMAAANDTASVMTAAYSKSDNTFAATAITDGTDVAGDTLKQDGNVLIDTVPTDWAEKNLRQLGITDTDAPPSTGFWLRLDVSVDLDSDVEIDVLLPMTRDFGEGVTSGFSGFYEADTEYSLEITDGQVGALEFGMQSGAAGVADLSWFKNGTR